MTDTLITAGITLVMTVGLSFFVGLIKKGQFENWGIVVGKALSKLGNIKLGKKRWERIEDAIVIAFVSFAQGLKKGADSDDEPEPESEETDA